MTKTVTVTMIGHQGADEEIQTKVPGNYFAKDDKHYIFFQEEVEGVCEPVKTRIEMSRNRLSLAKTGGVKAALIYDLECTPVTCYHTPAGIMEVKMETKQITIQEEEHRIVAKLFYDLELSGTVITDCDVEVIVESVIE